MLCLALAGWKYVLELRPASEVEWVLLMSNCG
jgi:hypothetical protein